MTDIIITGMSGVGKTTVGRIVAARLGMDFVDMDSEIEMQAGRSITQLFHEDGERAFRRREQDLLRSLRSGDGRVIATGGGTLIEPEARALLAAHQHVVSLACTPAEISRRVAGQNHRPLLDNGALERIEQLLADRTGVYSQFPQIDASTPDPEAVAGIVIQSVASRTAECLSFAREHTTDVIVLRGGLELLGRELRSRFEACNVILISDRAIVQTGIVDTIVNNLSDSGFQVHPVLLRAGEEQKCMGTITRLYDECARRGVDRRSLVLGVGGGVISDIAGFVAATYLRGIGLALVPTTLLAQVDASVGGKVGVDFDGTKNLVGAFWPATLVLIDPAVLNTLPADLMRDGTAEIVKIAFMRSIDLVQSLEASGDLKHIAAGTSLIRAAVRLKLAVVASDPYELNLRALLNFGHTIGHGLEAASGYELSHGACVSVGMLAETRLAAEMGQSDAESVARLHRLLVRIGLPTAASDLARADVLAHVLRDKKRRGNEYRLAVPGAPGHGHVIEVTTEQLEKGVDLALDLAA